METTPQTLDTSATQIDAQVAYVLDPQKDRVLRTTTFRNLLKAHVFKVGFAKKSGELTERVVTLRKDMIPTTEGHTLDASIKDLHEDYSSVYDIDKGGWIKINTLNVRSILRTNNRHDNP